MKITESELKGLIKEEAERMLQDDRQSLKEELTDKEYEQVVEIIRAELARVFHEFYRKRNFWA